MFITHTREFAARLERAKANGSKVARAIVKYFSSYRLDDSLKCGRWRTKKIKRRGNTPLIRIVQDVDENTTHVWSPYDFTLFLEGKCLDSGCKILSDINHDQRCEFDAYFSGDAVLHVERGKSVKFITHHIQPAVSDVPLSIRDSVVAMYGEFYTKVFPTAMMVAAVTESGETQAFGFIVNDAMISEYGRDLLMPVSWMEIYSPTDAGAAKLQRYAKSVGIQVVTDAITDHSRILSYEKEMGKNRGFSASVKAFVDKGRNCYVSVPLKCNLSYKGGFPGTEALKNVAYNRGMGTIYVTNNYGTTMSKLGYADATNKVHVRGQVCCGCEAFQSSYTVAPLCPVCADRMKVGTAFGGVVVSKGRKVKNIGMVPDYFFDANGNMKHTAVAAIMMTRFNKTCW